MNRNRYAHDYLFSSNYYKVPKEHNDLLKTLVGSYEESDYANKILLFNYEDNKHIDIKTFKKLSITFSFFVRFIYLNESFKEKHGVKDIHLSLMRRTYMSFNSYEEVYFGFGYKRPYGNSYVKGDIFEEYKTIHYKEYKKKIKDILEKNNIIDWDINDLPYEIIDEFMDKHRDFLWDIHFKTMEIVEVALKELDLNIIDFINESRHDLWEIGKKTVRYRKLKEIERDKNEK